MQFAVYGQPLGGQGAAIRHQNGGLVFLRRPEIIGKVRADAAVLTGGESGTVLNGDHALLPHGAIRHDECVALFQDQDSDLRAGEALRREQGRQFAAPGHRPRCPQALNGAGNIASFHGAAVGDVGIACGNGGAIPLPDSQLQGFLRREVAAVCPEGCAGRHANGGFHPRSVKLNGGRTPRVVHHIERLDDRSRLRRQRRTGLQPEGLQRDSGTQSQAAVINIQFVCQGDGGAFDDLKPHFIVDEVTKL